MAPRLTDWPPYWERRLQALADHFLDGPPRFAAWGESVRIQGPLDVAGLARTVLFGVSVLAWAVWAFIGTFEAYAPLDRPRRQRVAVPGPPPDAGHDAGQDDYEGRFTDELAILVSDQELVCVQDRGWRGIWRAPLRDVRSITGRARSPAWRRDERETVLVRIRASAGRFSLILPPEPAERLLGILRAAP